MLSGHPNLSPQGGGMCMIRIFGGGGGRGGGWWMVCVCVCVWEGGGKATAEAHNQKP